MGAHHRRPGGGGLAARAPKVGDRAPDFTLHDQLGRQVSLAGELERAGGPSSTAASGARTAT